MTKKDFELIARVVAGTWDTTVRQGLARDFAEELSRIDPRFNRERFLAACKATPETLFEVWSPSNADK